MNPDVPLILILMDFLEQLSLFPILTFAAGKFMNIIVEGIVQAKHAEVDMLCGRDGENTQLCEREDILKTLFDSMIGL